MDRLSQKEVEDLLNEIDSLNIELNSYQTDAYNYLIDYVDMGDNGIFRSLEGDKLFNLCVDILLIFKEQHTFA